MNQSRHFQNWSNWTKIWGNLRDNQSMVIAVGDIKSLSFECKAYQIVRTAGEGYILCKRSKTLYDTNVTYEIGNVCVGRSYLVYTVEYFAREKPGEKF